MAIKPSGASIVALCDGTIGRIFETNHAFSIESDWVIELFIQFGVLNLDLKRAGLKRIAEEGQRAKIGNLIVEVDLALLGKEKSIFGTSHDEHEEDL